MADPQSWNLYAYVRNNPLRYVDPTGRAIMGGPMGAEGKLPGFAWGGHSWLGGYAAPSSYPGSSVNSESNKLSPKSEQAVEEAAKRYGFNAETFKAKILAAAAKYNVNPNLLVGLAFRESGLNPGAINKKENARGLFQIRPARQQDLKISDADIFKTGVQIEKVAAAMKTALDRYQGDVDKAIASWPLGDSKFQGHYRVGGMERVRSLLMNRNDPTGPRLGPFYIDFVKSFF